MSADVRPTEQWLKPEDKGTYSMPVTCTNCGASTHIEVQKGKEFSKGTCPVCECRTLRKNR